MLNQVSLVGRLARDPKTINFEESQKVTLILAVERNYRNRKGNVDTDFIYVTAWGRLAEQCSRYLSKGRLIALRGNIEVDSWDDKETGDKKYRTEVVAQEIRFLDSVRDSKEDNEVESA